jgi:DNA-directed RNA polymerase subunit M/transcription elongation factor TFIIS
MVFKGCDRCRGDLYREEDIGQTDLVCLQCGYRRAADHESPITTIYRTRRETRQDRQSVRLAA